MEKIILCLLFIGLNSFAQEEQVQNTFEYTSVVLKKIEELSSLTPEEYLSGIKSYNNSLEKFIDHKKRVCNGEFSAFILGAPTEEEGTKNKLTLDEKELCFRELKSVQTKYIEASYKVRERFLKWQYEQDLISLETSKKEALSQLTQAYNKRKVKKRRRRK